MKISRTVFEIFTKGPPTCLHPEVTVLLSGCKRIVIITVQKGYLTLLSLELFHEITNRLSRMRHIHVHMPSGDQCQSPTAISSHSSPFSVLISIVKVQSRERFTNRPIPPPSATARFHCRSPAGQQIFSAFPYLSQFGSEGGILSDNVVQLTSHTEAHIISKLTQT